MLGYSCFPIGRIAVSISEFSQYTESGKQLSDFIDVDIIFQGSKGQ